MGGAGCGTMTDFRGTSLSHGQAQHADAPIGRIFRAFPSLGPAVLLPPEVMWGGARPSSWLQGTVRMSTDSGASHVFYFN